MSGYRVPTNLPSTLKMIAPGLAMIGHVNLNPGEMLGYDQNTKKVATLREILGSSVLGFTPDYSKGYVMLLPHLAPQKAAEQLAAGTATQALSTNDFAEARSDLFVAVDLVRLNDNEPIMISHLVQIALESIAVSVTWEVLQDSRWTDAQLSELQAKWQGMDLFSNSVPVLRMEGAFDMAALADGRRSFTNIGMMTLSSTTPTVSSNGTMFDELHDKLTELYDRYPRYWKWRSSWSYAEELYLLQIEDAAVQSCLQAQTNGALVPTLKEYDRFVTNFDLLHSEQAGHFILFGGEGEMFKRYLFKAADAEATRRLTVTAIALKRYQLAHNAYPASLSELVPQYLAEVPIDFMDGKPLRYKRQPDGNFLLYSVGEDGEDNGGDPTPTTGNGWLKGRDIVWPRAATAKEIEDYQKAQGKKSASMPAQ